MRWYKGIIAFAESCGLRLKELLPKQTVRSIEET